MPRGGARNRSGPAANPDSGRSDRRGFKLTALPAEGYRGAIPDFPLPEASDRELAVWEALWRTPQACAWSMPSEAWRARTVALYTRTVVRCEDPAASSSLLGQLHRFADQIGMTTAGLAEMGWKVAEDQVSKRAAERVTEPRESSRDRLSVVNGGD
jgi:hypothetical protein